ncbi:MAG: cyclic pyranopterin monophosphate synthase MoaC [Myxococcales bacterium]|nr:cyclic pyranopterin monophosphate synthase MoaC [Myxococcales bacterium]MCB9703976.1 cyclic pyranopterin monophosphate synthase MoaC [Myxococcales bacterium]
MSDEADPLTHFDAGGAAHMVAITAKPETPRMASARARVRMAAATLQRIREGSVGKGDVLAVARLAAIGGAKQTSTLIPLCHPVRVTAVSVEFTLDDALPGVIVDVRVEAHDRTGPDMEAMSAAATAGLTIYDMCKAMDRGMTIEAIALTAKGGGKSGTWTRGA